ncbi:MAG: hypothetical protein Q8920_16275 [Bacillota bacterium]|nr:hypothetical protein [Bacillota bacterium]
MNLLTSIFGAIIILWIAIHTFSYGIWSWRHKNKPGGIAVFLLSFLVIIMPLYIILMRGK